MTVSEYTLLSSGSSAWHVWSADCQMEVSERQARTTIMSQSKAVAHERHESCQTWKEPRQMEPFPISLGPEADGSRDEPSVYQIVAS